MAPVLKHRISQWRELQGDTRCESPHIALDGLFTVKPFSGNLSKSSLADAVLTRFRYRAQIIEDVDI
jgi:hypothetical protein